MAPGPSAARSGDFGGRSAPMLRSVKPANGATRACCAGSRLCRSKFFPNSSPPSASVSASLRALRTPVRQPLTTQAQAVSEEDHGCRCRGGHGRSFPSGTAARTSFSVQASAVGSTARNWRRQSAIPSLRCTVASVVQFTASSYRGAALRLHEFSRAFESIHAPRVHNARQPLPFLRTKTGRATGHKRY